VYGAVIGHVVTNVGGCLKILKAQSKWSCLYGCLKAQQQEAMRLQTNALLRLRGWLIKDFKNTDYSGYTERFRKLQARHLMMEF
jgi:hypothetical protein